MGVLEKNRPQVTAKSGNNVAVQKPTSQSKAPEKAKANAQEKSSAPKKADDGSKKPKTAATSASSKTSAAKVCIAYHRNRQYEYNLTPYDIHIPISNIHIPIFYLAGSFCENELTCVKTSA